MPNMTDEPKSWERKTEVVPIEREVENVDQYRKVYLTATGEQLDNRDLTLLRWYFSSRLDPKTNFPIRERAIYCKSEDKIDCKSGENYSLCPVRRLRVVLS